VALSVKHRVSSRVIDTINLRPFCGSSGKFDPLALNASI
jgi:hypothetical protein